MTRTWPAILASGVAIAVLLALIYASRPLPDQAYERHYRLQNALSTTTESYTSLRTQLSAGRRDVTQLQAAVTATRTRLEAARRDLAATLDEPAPTTNEHQEFHNALTSVLTNTAQAGRHLEALDRALAVLREDGPRAVQLLRQNTTSETADRFYTLWLSVYEYGLGTSADRVYLESQLDSFASDATPLPAELGTMIGAMRSLLADSEPLEQAIAAIDQAALGAAATRLATVSSAEHAATIRTRNNARILLSLYSMLLFAGLGLVVYRLDRSNRELNEAHEDLRLSNAELEERVDVRTHSVNQAYADLKHSQVQLVQAEKMSSLGQLVAGISHEINTPLLYLQSNTTLNKEALERIAEFIDMCHAALSPQRNPDESIESARVRFLANLERLRAALVENEVREELREVIALVDDNLEGLDELTRMAQGLKDFSRLDRAPVEHFSLNECVERTLIIVKNLLKRRVRVTTSLGEVPPVYCAPSQINQVLLNLITNASQAIEGDGEITISTFVDADDAVVSIRDTGSGISPEIMSKIRDPFFTTKEVGSGTGLGLSIVDEIIRKHGGRLDIESAVGQGSTFTVRLPIDRTADQVQSGLDRETQREMPPAGPDTGAVREPPVAHPPLARVSSEQ